MKKIVALLLIVSLLACSLTASFAEEAQLPAGSVPDGGLFRDERPEPLALYGRYDL